ncbi:MAG: nitrogenase-associated protein [Gammaproteobacteria bacterium]|nr:nitrogenase-associated protein [Gammaproteobacteria bacterium]
MSHVTFYEKPGCLSNGRQRALLRGLGHDLVVRNLLTVNWTPEELRSFFGGRPVREWFNPTAPRVKSGEVSPTAMDEGEALALMVADPILIRRPLMEVAGLRCCGFEPGPVLDALGVDLAVGADLQSCSHPTRGAGVDATCDAPASGGDRRAAARQRADVP